MYLPFTKVTQMNANALGHHYNNVSNTPQLRLNNRVCVICKHLSILKDLIDIKDVGNSCMHVADYRAPQKEGSIIKIVHHCVDCGNQKM